MSSADARRAAAWPSGRDQRLDMFWGLALVAIFIDHAPGTVYENWTSRNFGFSDAAEAFVLMSGIAAGLAYSPQFRVAPFWPGVARIWARARTLYLVHITTTVMALAIFAAAALWFGITAPLSTNNIGPLFTQPLATIIGLPLLTHQLGYFNILPLYLILLLVTPALLLVGRKHPWPVIFGSILVWALSGQFHLNLPNYPLPGGWFFNPLAWQLIFTLGLVSAILWRDGLPRPAPWLVVLSAATVAGAALIVTEGVGLAPGLRDAATAHLDVAKQDLGLARLIHFIALAYLIGAATTLGRRFVAPLIRGAFGEAVQSLGRNSLSVFAAGCLLSAGGQAALAAASPHASMGIEQFAGLAYTIGSIAALFAVAHWIECRSIPARVAGSTAPPSRAWRALRSSSPS